MKIFLIAVITAAMIGGCRHEGATSDADTKRDPIVHPTDQQVQDATSGDKVLTNKDRDPPWWSQQGVPNSEGKIVKPKN